MCECLNCVTVLCYQRCTRCKYWKLKGDVEPCKSCNDELSNFKEKEVEKIDKGNSEGNRKAV